MCQFYNSLHTVIYIYTLIMIVYAVLSWLPDLRGAWTRYLEMLVEPVLIPVRRIVPPAGGIDWSFLIVMVGLWLINTFVQRAAFNACFPI
ncbi:MAG: YggT family protein [Candidatus Baltobacteraceae bacterium]